MHRAHTAALTVVALAAVVAATTAATSSVHAGTSCQGRPATVVGPTSGNDTLGTEGDDVIVVRAEGRGSLKALGGDDLVCIVPGTAPVPGPDEDSSFVLDAGPGDDTVVNEEPRSTSTLRIVLGAGADSYTGNDRPEVVRAGEEPAFGAYLGADDSVDRISTGGGNDDIMTGNRVSSQPNHDQVSSGPGTDAIRHGGSGTTLDNGIGEPGDGLFLVRPREHQERVTVDNRTGLASNDTGVFLSWDNVRFVHVLTDSSIRYVGSDVDEILYVSSTVARDRRSALAVDVSLNGGDDELHFFHRSGFVPGSYDGGSGDDLLWPPRGCDRVEVVLNATFECRVTAPSTVTYTADLAGWEQTSPILARRSAVVTGTSGRDVVFINAQRIRARGLGGPDDIRVTPWIRSRATLAGGGGADVLHGSRGDDRLVGGRGRDRAVGGDGVDRCSAEVARRCERRESPE